MIPTIPMPIIIIAGNPDEGCVAGCADGSGVVCRATGVRSTVDTVVLA